MWNSQSINKEICFLFLFCKKNTEPLGWCLTANFEGYVLQIYSSRISWRKLEAWGWWDSLVGKVHAIQSRRCEFKCWRPTYNRAHGTHLQSQCFIMRLTVEKGESHGACKVACLVCTLANNQESLSQTSWNVRTQSRGWLSPPRELFYAPIYVTIKEFSIYFFKFWCRWK